MPVTLTTVTAASTIGGWYSTGSGTATTSAGGNWSWGTAGTSTMMVTTGTTATTMFGAGGGGGGGWYELIAAGGAGQARGGSGNVVRPTTVEIEQARRDREEATRVWREQSRAADTARRAAFERAEVLLLDWLTPGQAADYREHKRFDLVSSSGRWWRVNCGGGHAGNVQLLDEAGRWVATYCAHPPGGLPDPDAWLAQRLSLLTDEAGFLRVANCHGYENARYRAPARGGVPEPLQVTGQRMRLFTRMAA